MTHPRTRALQPTLLKTVLACLVLLFWGCGSDSNENDKPATDGMELTPDAGITAEADSGLQPDSSPSPQPDQGNPEAPVNLGKDCQSDADCQDPLLVCAMMGPVGLCALQCTPGEQCGSEPCTEQGFCPPCGDGFCDAKEQADPSFCPADCQGGTQGRTEDLTLTNPTSGVTLHGTLYFPEDASASKKYPAMALVPGGTGDGSSFEKQGLTQQLVDAGFIALTFDLDGRGQSGGTEDQCGHIHQDAINAFVELLEQRAEVDADRIGLMSSSFGITCASGMLSRYADSSPVKFLIDFEGPANRNDTGHCDAFDTGHITDQDCSDNVWWSEREASEHIKSVQVPYLRIQNEQDHAQPDNDHAVLMINNATSAAHGGNGVSPWTLVNDENSNQPNTVYTTAQPPVWFDNAASPSRVVFIQTMMNKFAPGA